VSHAIKAHLLVHGLPPEKITVIYILFVHADQGNRLGPHRMFVEFARTLGAKGYPIFRFDLRGCGDSSGQDAQGDMKQDLKDVTNAIHFFARMAQLQNVKIFAISRGARVAYKLLEDKTLPLSGLMLLSTPCSSTQAAAKNVRAALNQYLLKLTKPYYWIKFFSGKVSLYGIFRTIAHAWNIRRRYQERTAPKSNRCPLIFIYGQSDPIANQSMNYYQAKCQKMDFETHLIPGANHSFFHYRWKEEIIRICLQWLEKIEQRKNNVQHVG
jgi:pimeloyl-ACP methyl ester carboxylesterase